MQHINQESLYNIGPHFRILSTLPNRITEIYNNDTINTRLKHDITCRLIAMSIGASSVSLLLYKGTHNHLYCAGTYINPEPNFANARLKSARLKSNIIEIMQFISALEFLQISKNQSNINNLYNEYLSCPLMNPVPLSFNDFENSVFKNKILYEKNYLKYKEHFHEDTYKISTNDTITGLFYYALTHFSEKNEWTKAILAKKLSLLDSNKFLISDLGGISEKHKTYSLNIRKKLGIIIDTNSYYVGIPLIVNERPIGILRLLINKSINFNIPNNYNNEFNNLNSKISNKQNSDATIPVNYEFTNKEAILKYVTQTANCENIALLLGLHLNNSFYSHGMRQIAVNGK